MNDEHNGFELYLRQFRPRKPLPLPESPEPPKARWRLLWGAVAVAALLVTVAYWFETRSSSPLQDREAQIKACGTDLKWNPAPSELTMGRLHTYARRDPACLDLVLTESSRRVLPNVVKSEGALGVLAADTD